MSSGAAYLQGFLGHLASERRLSPLTCTNYGRDVAELLRLAGEIPLDQLQVHQIRRFIAQLHGRGLGGKTLARMLSAWRGFYAWLARDHGFTSNPCAGMRAPKSVKALPQALSPDEAVRLMEIPTEGDPLALRDKAMFELFYSSGLRLSELVNLPLSQIDLAAGMVRVTGKGGKTREVPVGRFALEAVRNWLPEREKLVRPEEYALFVGKNGTRLTPRAVQYRVKQWASNWAFRRTCIRTCCAIPLPAMCCSPAATCARCRKCSGMRISRRRRCTRIWIFSIWQKFMTRRIHVPRRNLDTFHLLA